MNVGLDGQGRKMAPTYKTAWKQMPVYEDHKRLEKNVCKLEAHYLVDL